MIPLRTPFSLFIEITNKCNFHCIFCPTGNEKLLREVGRQSGNMNLKLFSKIISDVQSFPDKLKRLHLYKSGEPLLHPDLPEMIKLSKEANISNEITTTTNLSLLTEELAVKIIESGLDSIRVSVESMSNEMYRKITRSRCNFEKIKRNIELLNETRRKLGRFNPSIYSTLIDFDLSLEEKQNFYEIFSNIADEIEIVKPKNWVNSSGHDFTLGKKKATNIDKKNSLQLRHVCPIPWYAMAINFKGQVSVCSADWACKAIIGDVRKESLLEIWHGSKLREFRRMQAKMKRHLHPACKDCDRPYLLSEKSDLDVVARSNFEKLL